MATTPAEFARRTRGASDRVEAEMKRGVSRASFEVKKSVQEELRRVVGADLRMSGVGRKGARVGVSYNVKGTRNPSSLVRAFGPVHLVERSTKPHKITPKMARGRRSATRAKALATQHGAFASVKHPGTRGQEPWARGVKRSRAAVDRELQQAFRKAVRAGLRIS